MEIRFKLPHRPRKQFNSFNDFAPVRIAGQGSFSVVWECFERNKNNQYAVKKIDLSKLSQMDRDNCETELKIHSKLSHPHIVKLIDFFIERNYLYLVLELCSRGTVMKLMNRRALDDYQSLKMFRQTCSAIYYLHSHDILMKDIKPENILIDENQNVKICDFGWSSYADDDKNNTLKAGTLAYMSPEAFLNKPQSFPSDVWSLGVLLFELTTNEEPFPFEHDADRLNTMIKNGAAVYKIKNNEIRNTVKKILKFHPEERPDMFDLMVDPCFVLLFQIGYNDNEPKSTDNPPPERSHKFNNKTPLFNQFNHRLDSSFELETNHQKSSQLETDQNQQNRSDNYQNQQKRNEVYLNSDKLKSDQNEQKRDEACQNSYQLEADQNQRKRHEEYKKQREIYQAQYQQQRQLQYKQEREQKTQIQIQHQREQWSEQSLDQIQKDREFLLEKQRIERETLIENQKQLDRQIQIDEFIQKEKLRLQQEQEVKTIELKRIKEQSQIEEQRNQLINDLLNQSKAQQEKEQREYLDMIAAEHNQQNHSHKFFDHKNYLQNQGIISQHVNELNSFNHQKYIKNLDYNHQQDYSMSSRNTNKEKFVLPFDNQQHDSKTKLFDENKYILRSDYINQFNEKYVNTIDKYNEKVLDDNNFINQIPDDSDNQKYQNIYHQNQNIKNSTMDHPVINKSNKMQINNYHNNLFDIDNNSLTFSQFNSTFDQSNFDRKMFQTENETQPNSQSNYFHNQFQTEDQITINYQHDYFKQGFQTDFENNLSHLKSSFVFHQSQPDNINTAYNNQFVISSHKINDDFINNHKQNQFDTFETENTNSMKNSQYLIKNSTIDKYQTQSKLESDSPQFQNQEYQKNQSEDKGQLKSQIKIDQYHKPEYQKRPSGEWNMNQTKHFSDELVYEGKMHNKYDQQQNQSTQEQQKSKIKKLRDDLYYYIINQTPSHYINRKDPPIRQSETFQNKLYQLKHKIHSLIVDTCKSSSHDNSLENQKKMIDCIPISNNVKFNNGVLFNNSKIQESRIEFNENPQIIHSRSEVDKRIGVDDLTLKTVNPCQVSAGQDDSNNQQIGQSNQLLNDQNTPVFKGAINDQELVICNESKFDSRDINQSNKALNEYEKLVCNNSRIDSHDVPLCNIGPINYEKSPSYVKLSNDREISKSEELSNNCNNQIYNPSIINDQGQPSNNRLSNDYQLKYNEMNTTNRIENVNHGLISIMNNHTTTELLENDSISQIKQNDLIQNISYNKEDETIIPENNNSQSNTENLETPIVNCKKESIDEKIKLKSESNNENINNIDEGIKSKSESNNDNMSNTDEEIKLKSESNDENVNNIDENIKLKSENNNDNVSNIDEEIKLECESENGKINSRDENIKLKSESNNDNISNVDEEIKLKSESDNEKNKSIDEKNKLKSESDNEKINSNDEDIKLKSESLKSNIKKSEMIEELSRIKSDSTKNNISKSNNLIFMKRSLLFKRNDNSEQNDFKKNKSFIETIRVIKKDKQSETVNGLNNGSIGFKDQYIGLKQYKLKMQSKKSSIDNSSISNHDLKLNIVDNNNNQIKDKSTQCPSKTEVTFNETGDKSTQCPSKTEVNFNETGDKSTQINLKPETKDFSNVIYKKRINIVKSNMSNDGSNIILYKKNPSNNKIDINPSDNITTFLKKNDKETFNNIFSQKINGLGKKTSQCSNGSQSTLLGHNSGIGSQSRIGHNSGLLKHQSSFGSSKMGFFKNKNSLNKPMNQSCVILKNQKDGLGVIPSSDPQNGVSDEPKTKKFISFKKVLQMHSSSNKYVIE